MSSLTSFPLEFYQPSVGLSEKNNHPLTWISLLSTETASPRGIYVHKGLWLFFPPLLLFFLFTTSASGRLFSSLSLNCPWDVRLFFYSWTDSCWRLSYLQQMCKTSLMRKMSSKGVKKNVERSVFIHPKDWQMVPVSINLYCVPQLINAPPPPQVDLFSDWSQHFTPL